jgi:hypothetical protein
VDELAEAMMVELDGLRASFEEELRLELAQRSVPELFAEMMGRSLRRERSAVFVPDLFLAEARRG